MPPEGISSAQRARQALLLLESQGGEANLPEVLARADVIVLMGDYWFGSLLRMEMLPGMRVRRGGIWRCERDTYLAWLREVAGEHREVAGEHREDAEHGSR